MSDIRRAVLLAAFLVVFGGPLSADAQTCPSDGGGGFLSGLTSFLDGLFAGRKAPTPTIAVPRMGERYQITFDHFQIFGDADFPPEEIGGATATVELLSRGSDARGETLDASIAFEGRPAQRFVLHRLDDQSFAYEKDGARFSLGFHVPTSLVSMAHFAVPANRPGPYDGYAPIKTDSFVSVSSMPIR